MLDKFKDECGVFGIFGHPEAANLTYLGLYALQHRGQESAGICTADGEKMRISRAMGHVAEAFDEPALESLPGHIAIGHTRYSTAGESRLLNAQPILIDCAHGQIAIAHNGNLVNASELRERLVRDGSIFQTSSDTEVVLHLYARSREHTVEDALVESLAQVSGAFSFALLTKDRLIAARDPHGFRPLCLGKLDGAYIVTSETCALDLIGATYVRDVEPGEVLIISDGGLRSLHPFPAAPLAHCIFEHVYFARPDSYVFGRSVNDVRTQLGRILAEESMVPADVVSPIPDSGVCGATRPRGSRWRWA
jgi:amidophosphoribosyltransferase